MKCVSASIKSGERLNWEVPTEKGRVHVMLSHTSGQTTIGAVPDLNLSCYEGTALAEKNRTGLIHFNSCNMLLSFMKGWVMSRYTVCVLSLILCYEQDLSVCSGDVDIPEIHREASIVTDDTDLEYWRKSRNWFCRNNSDEKIEEGARCDHLLNINSTECMW